MDRRAAPSPWVLFPAIAVLSSPVLVLGSLSGARIMPGLPLGAFMFLTIGAVAFWASWRAGGKAGMRALVGRLLDARRAKPWTWHLVSALVFPAVLLAEYVVMLAAHIPLPSPHVLWVQTPVLFALFFVAAAFEEVTWSATLLEPLQGRCGVLGAGLVIGVFVAALHVVPFAQVNPSLSWVVGQCLFTVGFRVVIAWIYSVSGRSLFAAVVCHAAYNTAWQLFPNQGSGYNPLIAAGLTWVVVGMVVAFGRRRGPSTGASRHQ
jgi:membrane protease YdiL (CAAX protease family)